MANTAKKAGKKIARNPRKRPPQGFKKETGSTSVISDLAAKPRPRGFSGDSVLVLGIDPGISGALVLINPADPAVFSTQKMPVGGDGRINYPDLLGILKCLPTATHVFLERAIPMAMGSKGAFNYGRGFETVVLAVENSGLPLTLVEPAKWTKEMLEGVSKELRPKVRSLQAAKRLYPKLVGMLPTKPKGGVHDGFVDALLIAGYGLRKLGGERRGVYIDQKAVVEDFGPFAPAAKPVLVGGGGSGGSGGAHGGQGGGARLAHVFVCEECGRDGARVHGRNLCPRHLHLVGEPSGIATVPAKDPYDFT